MSGSLRTACPPGEIRREVDHFALASLGFPRDDGQGQSSTVPLRTPTMKRPKVRLGTLMLLIIIVALATALLVERHKSAVLLANAEQSRAIQQEMLARAAAQVAAFNAQVRASQAASPVPSR
jgi:hypothetical protein